MADKVVQRLSDDSFTGGSPQESKGPDHFIRGNSIDETHNSSILQAKCEACEEEEKLQEKREEVIRRKPIFESNGELPETEVQAKVNNLPTIRKKCLRSSLRFC